MSKKTNKKLSTSKNSNFFVAGFCSCKTSIQYFPVHKRKDIYMDAGGRVMPGVITENCGESAFLEVLR